MKLLFPLLLLVVSVASQCPSLDLTWGTYQANETDLTCKYSNVRFASPPTGTLRFAAPVYPPATGVPPTPVPWVPYPGCIAMDETACASGAPGDEKGCMPLNFSNQTEDCLFLDIYVPKSVQNSTSRVPVVVWFYGGAYVFGSKTQYDPSIVPLYDGEEISMSSDKPVIYVAGNYRLGGFGWLAGTYMENNAQPNAGLLDQQAILKFVRDNIHLLNGDNTTVSAWGESAGASSLLHHLVMPENVQEPLFQRAILQSPAYQFLWNRTGTLNATYTSFSDYAGCSDGDINCLRSADIVALTKANQQLFQELSCTGIMPVGPSVDGNLVPDIPSNIFSQQKRVAKLNSIIVSHVDLEVAIVKNLSAFSFIPQPIRLDPTNPTKFDDFLGEFMSGNAYANIRANISATYPSANYADQVHRAQQVIMDSSFVCNTRVVLDAYMNANTPVYSMDYAFLADLGFATHASDLLPTFVTSQTNYGPLFQCMSQIPFIGAILSKYVTQHLGPGMQGYFANHAVYGDPNNGSTTYANMQWTQASVGACPSPSHNQCVTNVMRPFWNRASSGSPFSDNSVTDPQTSEDICGYWRVIAQQTMDACNNATGQQCTAPPRMKKVIEHESVDQTVLADEL